MNILSFILYCFIVTATPGTTNILILSTAQHFGTKHAINFAAGSILGFFILLTSSAIVNTFFAEVLPNFILIVQVIGTSYMLYIAYQIYKMDVSNSTAVAGNKNSFERGLTI